MTRTRVNLAFGKGLAQIAPCAIKATPASALPTTTLTGCVGDPKKVMKTVEDLRHQLTERTATEVTLSRFVTLLHRWMRKHSHKNINQCERKRQTGSAYLDEDEATAFLDWASALDKRCFTSLPIPTLWTTIRNRHTYNCC